LDVVRDVDELAIGADDEGDSNDSIPLVASGVAIGVFAALEKM
jgi:hypothetical protein